ncbi:MAG: glycerol-3-phosphate 1-O-acyltransferase PlsY [Pseudomonadota bacterium]
MDGPHGTYIVLILSAGASFLLGSLPFGKLISQWAGQIDITRLGSGNIGATNVSRALGLKWGILTLLLDLLKGFIPLIIYALAYSDSDLELAILGLSALIGHQFSPFMRFRGGKGVATSLGVFLAIAPSHALIALAFFILTVYLTDFVSLGSLLAALLIPILFILSGKSTALTLTALIMAALVFFRHKANILRLIKGEERGWRRR